MITLELEYTADDLRHLILKDMQSKLGEVKLDANKVCIVTKSKQNYKSEWEIAEFKATYAAKMEI